MRETGIMIKLMERADISTQMALSMMENGLTTNSVVLEPKSGQMEQSMKATGKTIRLMVREFSSMRMVMCMMVMCMRMIMTRRICLDMCTAICMPVDVVLPVHVHVYE